MVDDFFPSKLSKKNAQGVKFRCKVRKGKCYLIGYEKVFFCKKKV